eukprot:TRINITY_DN44232_c0_g1_i1.p1 TRINITY_DN44232_c0_g1~~TRINITY_DN44232_c0_g1_i1.p1  ORF type:complete len:1106 (+),score=183.73 TRINITY_DN44232_c0_g1_i1:189-3506(+)
MTDFSPGGLGPHPGADGVDRHVAMDALLRGDMPRPPPAPGSSSALRPPPAPARSLSKPFGDADLPWTMVHLLGAHVSDPENPTSLCAIQGAGAEDATPELEDISRDQRMLLQIRPDKECLLGFAVPDDWTPSSASSTGSRTHPPGTCTLAPTELEKLELRIRLPLYLAAGFSRNIWRQELGPRRRYLLQVQVATEETRASMQAMCMSMYEPLPVCNFVGAWLFDLQSNESLIDLLVQLQQTGCVMRHLERRYTVGDVIGIGASSSVLLAEDTFTGEPAAVKVCMQKQFSEDIALLREATILRWARHESMLQFHGIFEAMDVYPEGRAWAIVTEFIGGGELFDEVRRGGPLAEPRTRLVTHQLFSAIDFLHKRGIVHRDIKTENVILVSQRGSLIKLVDFGLATPEWDEEAMKMRCGSPGYIAPEVLRGEKYGCKIDCFAIGVLVYILITGYGPFCGNTVDEMLLGNMRCHPNLSVLDRTKPAAKELVKRLLVPQPDIRPGAEECLQMAWLANAKDEANVVVPPPPCDALGPPSTPNGLHDGRQEVRRMFSSSLIYSDIVYRQLEFSQESRDAPMSPNGNRLQQWSSMVTMHGDVGAPNQSHIPGADIGPAVPEPPPPPAPPPGPVPPVASSHHRTASWRSGDTSMSRDTGDDSEEDLGGGAVPMGEPDRQTLGETSCVDESRQTAFSSDESEAEPDRYGESNVFDAMEQGNRAGQRETETSFARYTGNSTVVSSFGVGGPDQACSGSSFSGFGDSLYGGSNVNNGQALRNWGWNNSDELDDSRDRSGSANGAAAMLHSREEPVRIPLQRRQPAGGALSRRILGFQPSKPESSRFEPHTSLHARPPLSGSTKRPVTVGQRPELPEPRDSFRNSFFRESFEDDGARPSGASSATAAPQHPLTGSRQPTPLASSVASSMQGGLAGVFSAEERQSQFSSPAVLAIEASFRQGSITGWGRSKNCFSGERSERFSSDTFRNSMVSMTSNQVHETERVSDFFMIRDPQDQQEERNSYYFTSSRAQAEMCGDVDSEDGEGEVMSPTSPPPNEFLREVLASYQKTTPRPECLSDSSFQSMPGFAWSTSHPALPPRPCGVLQSRLAEMEQAQELS